MASDVDTGINLQQIGVCHEKQHLMEELTAAIREVLTIQHQQFRAVVNLDSDFSRFDILMEMATARKRQIKYAYLHHVETHGC